MSREEYRESAIDLKFPRHTLVSLLVFVVCWEVLSVLAPALGIPPFAIPSFVKIAKSFATITPIDVVVTLARVIGALIVSFLLGVALAMAMYRSELLEKYLHPMIRLLMAVPVVSWILFAVLWFPGVEFRIGFVLVIVCGPVFLIDSLDAMKGVPRELRHMMRSFRPTTVPVLPEADAAGDRAEHLHQLESEYQPGHSRRHHRRAGRRGDRHRPPTVGRAGIVLGRRRVRLDAGAGGAAVPAGSRRRPRRDAPAAVARMSGPPPIEARGLRKVFRQATTGQSVVAIDRLDLTIAPREVVAIVGQTGCGKSTFFDLMIGLEAPTEGTLNIGDKSPFADFDHFRGRIATVFQQDRLLAWRSALDNAKLPLELIGLPETEQRERALTWLNRLGLGNFTNAYPHELSGGMRQRVAIARAFAVQPDILLADEAFGHLDEVTAAELRETFLQLARECGSTAVLITHQLEEAIGVGDRIVVFGKSAKLLADIHVAQWPKSRYAVLREMIQSTLQANSPDPRLMTPELATG